MSSSTNIPESYICPLSKKIMWDPVTAADGYNYEREWIERYIASHVEIPSNQGKWRSKMKDSNHPMFENRDLVANTDLCNSIKTFMQNFSGDPYLQYINNKTREQFASAITNSHIGGNISKIRNFTTEDKRLVFLKTIYRGSQGGITVLDLASCQNDAWTFGTVVDLIKTHDGDNLKDFFKSNFAKYCKLIVKNVEGGEGVLKGLIQTLQISSAYCKEKFLSELRKNESPEGIAAIIDFTTLSVTEKLLYDNFLLKKQVKELTEFKCQMEPILEWFKTQRPKITSFSWNYNKKTKGIRVLSKKAIRVEKSDREWIMISPGGLTHGISIFEIEFVKISSSSSDFLGFTDEKHIGNGNQQVAGYTIPGVSYRSDGALHVKLDRCDRENSGLTRLKDGDVLGVKLDLTGDGKITFYLNGAKGTTTSNLKQYVKEFTFVFNGGNKTYLKMYYGNDLKFPNCFS